MSEVSIPSIGNYQSEIEKFERAQYVSARSLESLVDRVTTDLLNVLQIDQDSVSGKEQVLNKDVHLLKGNLESLQEVWDQNMKVLSAIGIVHFFIFAGLFSVTASVGWLAALAAISGLILTHEFYVGFSALEKITDYLNRENPFASLE